MMNDLISNENVYHIDLGYMHSYIPSKDKIKNLVVDNMEVVRCGWCHQVVSNGN